MSNPSVGLVVIGRNSRTNLEKIYTHQYVSELRKTFKELVYIDSNSTDTSVEFMKQIGFEVYQVKADENSAALGRKVGTSVSQSDYICYLDSDMELKPIKQLRLIIDKLNIEKDAGFVGDVLDVYEDGAERLRARKVRKEATSFGGFVILNRDHVIRAGNWNEKLKANEELELYVKLKANDLRVLYKPSIHVRHYTVVSSPFHELLSLYLPLRKERFGSLGMVLKQLKSAKSVYCFLSLQPELFVFLTSLLVFFINPAFAFTSLVMCVVMVCVRRSWKFNLVVPGLLLSVIVGLCKKSLAVNFSYEKK